MATEEHRASNGHLMVYRVIEPTFPGGEPSLSQWDAEHSDNCACHTSGDATPLPDY